MLSPILCTYGRLTLVADPINRSGWLVWFWHGIFLQSMVVSRLYLKHHAGVGHNVLDIMVCARWNNAVIMLGLVVVVGLKLRY